MSTPPIIEVLPGPDAASYAAPLARLRIEVFREWPYLYDGDTDYEQQYLRSYFECPQSIVIIARLGEHIVGASTALPLIHAEADMQTPFRQARLPLEQWLYFGESVVQAAFRGMGLGVAFFAERETHARQLGLTHCTFCAVERPENHPARPPNHIGNERFWQHRGYRPMDLRCQFAWPDIGSEQATEKPMRFWQRGLPAISGQPVEASVT